MEQEGRDSVPKLAKLAAVLSTTRRPSDISSSKGAALPVGAVTQRWAAHLPLVLAYWGSLKIWLFWMFLCVEMMSNHNLWRHLCILQEYVGWIAKQQQPRLGRSSQSFLLRGKLITSFCVITDFVILRWPNIFSVKSSWMPVASKEGVDYEKHLYTGCFRKRVWFRSCSTNGCDAGTSTFVTVTSFWTSDFKFVFFSQENRCIKELNIGKNFFGIKAKFFKRTMESVVELIQEEDSVKKSSFVH